MYRSSHARAVFGLILGEIPDSCWEGIRIRVIYVSLRDKFHVFVVCGDRVTITVIPVCRIADREVNHGKYLRVDSVITLLIALEIRFLKSATDLPSMRSTSYSVSLLAK